MRPDFYKKLNGWPTIILGVLILASAAFYIFYLHNNLEAERVQVFSELEAAHIDNYSLIKELKIRKDIINGFEGQITNISSTVGTLEKLSQTDPELLKKYSKIYFLNENYIPEKLVDIESKYVSQGATNYMFNAKAWPYLDRLLRDANDEGINLRVASAFRSFGTQAALKSNYNVTYGSGANAFSADQGYSEHQLGTAVDLTTEELGPVFSAFASDPAYKWLTANAYKYGFILSYPEKNGYYKFEPWHWRFVGISLSRALHNEGKHFYDLDQREIDNYLINIFD